MATTARRRPSRVREASPPSRLLIDANVVLDVLLGRSPWNAEAQVLFDRVASGAVVGLVAAHTLTTIHYLVERAKGRATARATVRDLLALFEVASVGREELQRAQTLGTGDFEDAVQVAAAISAGADCIVTRDRAGFRGSPIAVLTPSELVARFVTRPR